MGGSGPGQESPTALGLAFAQARSHIGDGWGEHISKAMGFRRLPIARRIHFNRRYRWAGASPPPEEPERLLPPRD
jgi:hypothetical protein